MTSLLSFLSRTLFFLFNIIIMSFNYQSVSQSFPSASTFLSFASSCGFTLLLLPLLLFINHLPLSFFSHSSASWLPLPPRHLPYFAAKLIAEINNPSSAHIHLSPRLTLFPAFISSTPWICPSSQPGTLLVLIFIRFVTIACHCLSCVFINHLYLFFLKVLSFLLLLLFLFKVPTFYFWS